LFKNKIQELQKGIESLSKIVENVDTLRVLFMLEKGTFGRKSISKNLSLGEGYVRKLLTRLEQKRLIKRSRKGTELTEKGKRVLNEIKKVLYAAGNIDLKSYENLYGVIVKNASRMVYKGLEERDEAIRLGAKGAMVLTYENGKLWFPAIECITDKYPEIDSAFRNSIKKLEEGDVIIAAWSESKLNAERGAFAAAILLAQKSGMKIKNL
jgi:predicted transcriptional regulator